VYIANFDGVAGGANTGKGGGGGGGGASQSRGGANGGSGLIIIKYTIGGTLSISYSGGSQAIYRTSGTITATASTSGYVSFYSRGKVIPGCKNKLINASNIATCTWRPSVHGSTTISATSMSSKSSNQISSASMNLTVVRRTGAR
jgi:hypothetical protein